MVGAGPAGLAAALMLAQRGWKVKATEGGFRVFGFLGFEAWGFGFGVLGLRFRVLGAGVWGIIYIYINISLSLSLLPLEIQVLVELENMLQILPELHNKFYNYHEIVVDS